METPTTPTPTETLRGFFPESAEAVNLVLRAIAIAGAPVPDGEDDAREQAIYDMMGSEATPQIRTRVAVITETLRELCGTIRAATMSAKSDSGDPDLTEGHAEVTEDGYLVVSVGDKEIGRVPFDPRRTDGTETKLANDMLAEWTRLNIAGRLEARNIAEGRSAPGRKTVVHVVADEPAAAIQ